MPQLAFARNRLANRGAIVNPRAVQAQNPQARYDPQDPRLWRCDPANAQYVAAFCDLCRSRRIDVVWLLPPVSPQQQNMADNRHFEDRFLPAVRDLAGPYPNVTVVDGRRAGYPNEVFLDHTHLDRVGAAELSAALASVMARPAGGWVDLPKFTGGRYDEGLEDLVESAESLKTAGDAGP